MPLMWAITGLFWKTTSGHPFLLPRSSGPLSDSINFTCMACPRRITHGCVDSLPRPCNYGATLRDITSKSLLKTEYIIDILEQTMLSQYESSNLLNTTTTNKPNTYMRSFWTASAHGLHLARSVMQWTIMSAIIVTFSHLTTSMSHCYSSSCVEFIIILSKWTCSLQIKGKYSKELKFCTIAWILQSVD